jgi:predicted metal-dependent phosphoesterase TrpH
MDLFNTLSELENFSEIKKLSLTEKESISKYLNEGGIIKAKKDILFKIVYPSKDIIKKELHSIMEDYNSTLDKIQSWEKVEKDANSFIENNKIKKFINKTFWLHKFKSISDKTYKDDFKKINIPIEYIGDESINKVVETFIKDLDYRKKLIETIETSIVYKNKGIGEKIIKKIALQKEISKNKLEILYKRKTKLEDRILFYKLILKWAN